MVSGVVSELWTYPLTGGRGVSLDQARHLPGGIEGSRDFILAEETDSGLVRIGSKHAPELSRLEFAGAEHLDEIILGDTAITLPINEAGFRIRSDALCDEFGDAVPVQYMDASYDAVFSNYLERPVRLVRKTLPWLMGEVADPSNWSNAPLHIVSEETIEWLKVRNNSEAIDSRRLRASIVLLGLAANEELDLIGCQLYLPENDITIVLDRPTPRCVVPSRDPETGASLKDVSLKKMEKAPSLDDKLVACAGVYGYLEGFDGSPKLINVGDEFSIV